MGLPHMRGGRTPAVTHCDCCRAPLAELPWALCPARGATMVPFLDIAHSNGAACMCKSVFSHLYWHDRWCQQRLGCIRHLRGEGATAPDSEIQIRLFLAMQGVTSRHYQDVYTMQVALHSVESAYHHKPLAAAPGHPESLPSARAHRLGKPCCFLTRQKSQAAHRQADVSADGGQDPVLPSHNVQS